MTDTATDAVPVAKNLTQLLSLLPALINRHGCITGATGTGKTVTLQVIAEALSACGVPVFMADVKGDLSGLAKAGAISEKTAARLKERGLPEPAWQAVPVTFWDVFGEKGHPVRATISDMGPLLLARMLNLNETQQGVLQLVFKIADDNGLLLLDVQGSARHAAARGRQCGLVQDRIRQYFGSQHRRHPARHAGHRGAGRRPIFRRTDAQYRRLAANRRERAGHGQYPGGRQADERAAPVCDVPALDAVGSLFEQLPEVGDVDKPKLVFFFDEAHLLFDEAPRALLQKIEQVVRLIRSKGVGVYFVTQNPLDIPDTVLGQLGNRVQHALRAYTPRDQKAVQAAADTFRPNPALDTAQVITELGVGEALVSFLDAKGAPTMVERAFVLTPGSQIGALDEAERRAIIAASIVAGVYETTVDRESAYEKMKGRVAAPPERRHRRHHRRRQTLRRRPMAAASAICWAGYFPAKAAFSVNPPAVATLRCRQCSSRPRARSVRRSAARSFAACWARY